MAAARWATPESLPMKTAAFFHYAADGLPRHVVTQRLQLAVDAAITPVGILGGETEHQVEHAFGFDRLSTSWGQV